MAQTFFTESEKAGMRLLSDPGFERHNDEKITSGWSTETGSLSKVEYYQDGEAHTGLANVILKSAGKETKLYTVANLEKNRVYELSCYVRCSEGFQANGVRLYAAGEGGSVLKSAAFNATAEWTKISMFFSGGENTVVQVGIISAGGADHWLRVDDFNLFLHTE